MKQPDYLPTVTLIRKYPKLIRGRIRAQDLATLVRIGIIDGYFNTTKKCYMILESEVYHIVRMIDDSDDRRKDRRQDEE